MPTMVAEQELYRSCLILFGNELQVDRGFLNYLQPSGLKKAYRLKARQTHPDLTNTNPLQSGTRYLPDFCSVQQAYENLCGYLADRERGFSFPAESSPGPAKPAPGPRTRNPGGHHDWRGKQTGGTAGRPKDLNRGDSGRDNPYTKLYRGPLPMIRLRLGHFMYYSGMIDWMTVVRALIWQRAQRARLGELASRFGWLSDREISQVLANRNMPEQFGASAVRNRLLTERQLQVLLGYQKLLQKKFGAFFLEEKLLNSAQLEKLVRQQCAHNAACPASGAQ